MRSLETGRRFDSGVTVAFEKKASIGLGSDVACFDALWYLCARCVRQVLFLVRKVPVGGGWGMSREQFDPHPLPATIHVARRAMVTTPRETFR